MAGLEQDVWKSELAGATVGQVVELRVHADEPARKGYFRGLLKEFGEVDYDSSKGMRADVRDALEVILGDERQMNNAIVELDDLMAEGKSVFADFEEAAQTEEGVTAEMIARRIAAIRDYHQLILGSPDIWGDVSAEARAKMKERIERVARFRGVAAQDSELLAQIKALAEGMAKEKGGDEEEEKGKRTAAEEALASMVGRSEGGEGLTFQDPAFEASVFFTSLLRVAEASGINLQLVDPAERVKKVEELAIWFATGPMTRRQTELLLTESSARFERSTPLDNMLSAMFQTREILGAFRKTYQGSKEEMEQFARTLWRPEEWDAAVNNFEVTMTYVRDDGREFTIKPAAEHEYGFISGDNGPPASLIEIFEGIEFGKHLEPGQFKEIVEHYGDQLEVFRQRRLDQIEERYQREVAEARRKGEDPTLVKRQEVGDLTYLELARVIFDQYKDLFNARYGEDYRREKREELTPQLESLLGASGRGELAAEDLMKLFGREDAAGRNIYEVYLEADDKQRFLRQQFDQLINGQEMDVMRVLAKHMRMKNYRRDLAFTREEIEYKEGMSEDVKRNIDRRVRRGEELTRTEQRFVDEILRQQVWRSKSKEYSIQSGGVSKNLEVGGVMIPWFVTGDSEIKFSDDVSCMPVYAPEDDPMRDGRWHMGQLWATLDRTDFDDHASSLYIDYLFKKVNFDPSRVVGVDLSRFQDGRLHRMLIKVGNRYATTKDGYVELGLLPNQRPARIGGEDYPILYEVMRGPGGLPVMVDGQPVFEARRGADGKPEYEPLDTAKYKRVLERFKKGEYKGELLYEPLLTDDGRPVEDPNGAHRQEIKYDRRINYVKATEDGREIRVSNDKIKYQKNDDGSLRIDPSTGKPLIEEAGVPFSGNVFVYYKNADGSLMLDGDGNPIRWGLDPEVDEGVSMRIEVIRRRMLVVDTDDFKGEFDLENLRFKKERGGFVLDDDGNPQLEDDYPFDSSLFEFVKSRGGSLRLDENGNPRVAGLQRKSGFVYREDPVVTSRHGRLPDYERDRMGGLIYDGNGNPIPLPEYLYAAKKGNDGERLWVEIKDEEGKARVATDPSIMAKSILAARLAPMHQMVLAMKYMDTTMPQLDIGNKGKIVEKGILKGINHWVYLQFFDVMQPYTVDLAMPYVSDLEFRKKEGLLVNRAMSPDVDIDLRFRNPQRTSEEEQLSPFTLPIEDMEWERRGQIIHERKWSEVRREINEAVEKKKQLTREQAEMVTRRVGSGDWVRLTPNSRVYSAEEFIARFVPEHLWVYRSQVTDINMEYRRLNALDELAEAYWVESARRESVPVYVDEKRNEIIERRFAEAGLDVGQIFRRRTLKEKYQKTKSQKIEPLKDSGGRILREYVILAKSTLRRRKIDVESVEEILRQTDEELIEFYAEVSRKTKEKLYKVADNYRRDRVVDEEKFVDEGRVLTGAERIQRVAGWHEDYAKPFRRFDATDMLASVGMDTEHVAPVTLRGRGGWLNALQATQGLKGIYFGDERDLMTAHWDYVSRHAALKALIMAIPTKETQSIDPAVLARIGLRLNRVRDLEDAFYQLYEQIRKPGVLTEEVAQKHFTTIAEVLGEIGSGMPWKQGEQAANTSTLIASFMIHLLIPRLRTTLFREHMPSGELIDLANPGAFQPVAPKGGKRELIEVRARADGGLPGPGKVLDGVGRETGTAMVTYPNEKKARPYLVSPALELAWRIHHQGVDAAGGQLLLPEQRLIDVLLPYGTLQPHESYEQMRTNITHWLARAGLDTQSFSIEQAYKLCALQKVKPLDIK